MHKTARCPRFCLLLAVLLLLPLLVSPLQAAASPLSPGEKLQDVPLQLIIAEAGGENAGRKVLPAVNYLGAETPQTATIQVNYLGSWDPDAKAAFEYAKKIWEAKIASPVPIVVEAHWEDLNYISPYVLGGASMATLRRNFDDAPLSNTWYPVALANKLYGSDLEAGLADIEAFFNSAFPAWYFGIDGNPGGNQYDFVSVVLHEIGHGLGFSGSMSLSGSSGSWGVGGSPYIYDRFVVNGSGQTLISSFENLSVELGAQLTGGDLYFSGSHAVAANGGVPPKLYAPTSWQQGSSYSHLDESTYKAGSQNALMTPALANGEVVHDPGPVTIGIFEDLGWMTVAKSELAFYGYLPAILSALPAVK